MLEDFEGALTEVEALGMVKLCAAITLTTITLTMEMQGRLLSRMAGKSGWESCYSWMT
ncbi:MAG: hypothetical protein ACYCY1_07865 [Sulfuriferula sp.]